MRKGVQNERLDTNSNYCYQSLTARLLADAEVGEDVVEEGVGGDGAGDGAEVVEGLADVLGDEVGGDAVLDGVDGAAEGVGAVGEGFVVAAVGHD